MCADTARHQRSTGAVRVRLGERDGRPQILNAYQAGAGRLRFPAASNGAEAMVLNTSGGLASSDRFAIEATVEAHTLTVSTQACERVYRAEEGGAAHVAQTYRVSAGARLRALPQPTIIFNGAHLRRETTVEVSTGGRLTLVEGLVLGRAAMGETITTAHIRDRVDVRVDGAPVFVDALRLFPAVFETPGNEAGLAGARASALAVHIGNRRTDEAVNLMRDAGAGEGVRVGASQVNNVAVARMLASSHGALHSALARIVQALDGVSVPRTWSL